MNVSLTPKLEKFIRQRVSSGLYGNASEVVRESLRLLIDKHNLIAEPQETAHATRTQICESIRLLEKPLRERGVRSISLFGSVVRDEATDASDVDVFIDIDPEFNFSLLDFVGVKLFLEDNLRRNVDVVTQEGIEPSIRETIIGESHEVF